MRSSASPWIGFSVRTRPAWKAFSSFFVSGGTYSATTARTFATVASSSSFDSWPGLGANGPAVVPGGGGPIAVRTIFPSAP